MHGIVHPAHERTRRLAVGSMTSLATAAALLCVAPLVAVTSWLDSAAIMTAAVSIASALSVVSLVLGIIAFKEEEAPERTIVLFALIAPIVVVSVGIPVLGFVLFAMTGNVGP